MERNNPMNPAGTIERVHRLIDISLLASVTLRSEVWWRGHSQYDWPLVPSVHRGAAPVGRESNLAVRFFQRAPTRYPHCPADTDFPGWLFLMQHHRLPTRLLDWTESILVAAYFACCDDPERDGALWALSPFKLNKAQVGTDSVLTPGHELARHLFRPPFTENYTPSAATIAVLTREIDLRMTVQLSAFTVHGSASPMESLPASESFLLKFTIPASQKAGIRANLFYLGIRESTLFPDLDHLASDLSTWDFDEPDKPEPPPPNAA